MLSRPAVPDLFVFTAETAVGFSETPIMLVSNCAAWPDDKHQHLISTIKTYVREYMWTNVSCQKYSVLFL